MAQHPLDNPWTDPGFPGYNKAVSKGGPSGIRLSMASSRKERDPLFTIYEHLAGQDRGDAALLLLRKAASAVKPIMQKHKWRVNVLSEFLPREQNLLGLNINQGHKICLRLRYHNDHSLFLPFEEVVDTLLHELCHNVWSEHDSNFHKLWEDLRDEHEALVRKGYTGEGFLSEGRTLGGSSGRVLPPHEMRELARINAEKRRAKETLFSGSGQRLGGTPVYPWNMREIRAKQAISRKAISTGCASGSHNAVEMSQQAASNAFKTKAEEDDANNRAIAQALQELMEQEEEQKFKEPFEESSNGAGLAWNSKSGLYDAGASRPTSSGGHDHPSEEEQLKWAMQDSMRYAGESPFGIEAPQQPLPGQDASTGDASSTASPKDSARGATPEDFERHHQVSPENGLPTQDDDKNNNGKFKRKRHSSQSNTSVVAENDWACEVCTCTNPLQYLACDACGVERPQSVLLKAQSSEKKTVPRREWEVKPPAQNKSLGWNCRCGAFMEHKWWTCTVCATMKEAS